MKWPKNYPKILLTIFTIFWIIIAIAPKYRGVWVAENILTVLLAALLILTYKKFKFSNLSYTLIFIFMILHVIGSYSSYSEMYLFDLIKQWFSLSRNHYDRVVHFLFGLMFYLPTYEFLTRKLKLKGGWAHLMTFLTITSFKGIFEIIEYLYVLVVRTEVFNYAYLGMQGDLWDAQKDTYLGMLGAGIAWFMMWVKNRLK